MDNQEEFENGAGHSLKKQSQLNLEAAEAVNNQAALDTPIEANDAPEADELMAKLGSANQFSTDQDVTPTLKQTGKNNSRELVWKTAEGTEKRLILPIDII